MNVPRHAAKLSLRARSGSSPAPVASTSRVPICQRVATARQFSSKPEGRGSRGSDAGSDLLSLLDRARDARHNPTPSPQSSSQGGWWDQILSDLDTEATESFRSATPISRKQMKASNAPTPRRVTMTVREQRAANNMFNQIFSSMSDTPAGGADGGIEKTGLSTYMGALSRSRRVTRPGEDPELEVELDRMNEAIDNALSDHELLQWAEREVFAQSFELAAAADARMNLPKDARDDGPLAPLQSATYPHAIAKLMRTFRDKYRDPHLALAVFAHARSLSIYSYVMGCTTAAYNELIQTRWECFRDLRGVYEAVQEMASNKVRRDSRTAALWENIRREVGTSATHSDGLYDILGRIDQMVGKDPVRRERSLRGETLEQRLGREKRIRRHKQGGGRDWNAWRNPAALESRDEEGLGFGEWERPVEKEAA
ncbi:unnamed protein product [Peniophora sp. CBMAI 1063]|nr:unnamed protein product [Peniophora sp. CBMAI 1063]